MTDGKCEQFEELLVKYADGLLGDDKAAEVTAHLESCRACADKLDALGRSLTLAQTIWEDNLDQPTQRAVARASLVRTLTRRWPVAAAAAVLIFAVAIVSHRGPLTQPPAPQLTAEQVEQQILAEGSAARLLAAAEILERKPHASKLARSQYKYILDYYPETKAAAQARTKTQ
jgi:anti-sigma factor RsiW